MGPTPPVAPDGEEWRNYFALVDCSSFYASCEKLLAPQLRDHPLIILSNNDGCVVSRCLVAKGLGIPLGVPVFKIKESIAKHHITVLSSNYELYADISRRVMECLGCFSPQIEVYSIDEAFLQVKADAMPFGHWAVALQKQIKRMTGIAVTVGIGPTKTLAKVASHLAKSIPQAQGVFWLNSKSGVQAALSDLPISELWGIGHRYRKKLKNLDIERVQQLLDFGEIWMEKHLGGVTGRRLWWELHGVACSTLKPTPPRRQQIAYSRSFSSPIENPGELENIIRQYISSASARLRNCRLAAHKMSVFLNTNRHRPGLPQHHPTGEHFFLQATTYTPEFIAAGRKLLQSMYRPGHRYIKAGVILWDLCGHNEIAPSLFIPSPRRQMTLMGAVDKINQLMGRDTLRPASFLRTASWQMRRNKLSPRATTRWTELPEVGRCLLRETGEPLPAGK